MGHAVRHKNTSLMSTVLMGRVEGKRKQGRPAKNLPCNLIDASGCSGLQAMAWLTSAETEMAGELWCRPVWLLPSTPAKETSDE